MDKHAFQSGWRILLLLALPFLLFAPTQAAVNIDDPFQVQMDYGTPAGGGCTMNQYLVLQTAFSEAIDMANAALSAIKKVKDSQQNWFFGDESARAATLQVLFGIKPSGMWGKISAPDLQRLNDVENVFKVIVDFSAEHHTQQYYVYCNDDWIHQDSSGRFFSPAHNVWFGKMTAKPCASDQKMGGYTTHIERNTAQGLNQITHCPNAFNGFPYQSPSVIWKPSLQNIKQNQKTIPIGDILDNYKSLPGHFLHEMAHLLQSRVAFDITDQIAVNAKGAPDPTGAKAYGFGNAYFLALKNPNLALGNADNYHFFALAMYFDEVDFATGAAKYIGKTKANVVTQGEVKDEPPAEVTPTTLLKYAAGPTLTDPGNTDPDVPVDTKQALIVSSMIDAITKTEIEKPKILPMATNQAMDAGRQEVLQDL